MTTKKNTKRKRKRRKEKKNVRKMTTTMPKNMGRVIESLPQSQHAVFVVKLGIATRTVGLWIKM
jgi:hypothetical protein